MAANLTTRTLPTEYTVQAALDSLREAEKYTVKAVLDSLILKEQFQRLARWKNAEQVSG